MLVSRFAICLLPSLCLLLTALVQHSQETVPTQKADQTKPLPPREELKTFQLDPHFTIELVAAEPQIVDPVAFCFDAKENLYVVEMRGYPNAGTGEGKPNFSGRVVKLEDRDGDGYYETATVFLDNLRFPCAITPWRKGFLIGDAPDLIYAEDTAGDGKADIKRVLYTGFGNKNIQQMINGLQFHFDNWVYGCNGGNDSPVRSMEKPDSPVVQLRGMHFRFKPDVPGSLEPTSGGGQYGLAATESGDWLTCTNSQHIRHIVLPDHYLKRNPYLAVPAVTLDIADHDAACKVFRISPFETWRVERTARRAGSADAKRFPSTELVPGGFVTSGCGNAVWQGGKSLLKDYQGNNFVCDPANNLIHRDVLVKDGSTFRAERLDKERDFLASTDTWFRPVFLANGPGGALYLADFYREIIETPLSLPDDIKARWNLNSRERGRIWKIRPKNSQPEQRRKMADFDPAALVNRAMNLDADGWSANTAQRLLFETSPTKEIQEEIKKYASLSAWEVNELGETRIRALWLLQAWNLLHAREVLNALQSPNPALQKQGLILVEHLLPPPLWLKEYILQLAEDSDPHVRLQLAFSLGEIQLPENEKAQALVRLAAHPEADQWLHVAVLSSVREVEFLTLRLAFDERRIRASFLEQLSAIISRAYPIDQLMQVGFLQRIKRGTLTDRHIAIIQGLGAAFVGKQPDLVAKLLSFVKEQKQESRRQKAISVLGLVPFADAEAILRTLLQSQEPPYIQQAALLALSRHADPQVGKIVLELWPTWSPSIRREAQEVLFSRPAFIEQMLSAVEENRFPIRQLDPARREQLLHHPYSGIRKRAQKLLSSETANARSDVLKRYQSSLTMTADVQKGKVLFQKNCATCHQFDGQGFAVGPDLHSALGNKTKEALLIDILDPNREVDSRYVNYIITTKQGRTITGTISSESASSVTLRRAEGVEETCLRADIDEIKGTGKSLMPENLEEQLGPQDIADVMGYLLAVRAKK
jgi:putative membrane-bound dehydrogenase-like protein